MLHRDVAEGIHMVEDAYTNWFLVEDAGRVTVVDTGFPRSWRALGESLSALGRSTTDVDAVLLTHGHFDHVGFADRARRELGVPLYAHVKEMQILEHPRDYDHARPRWRYAVREPHFRKVLLAMALRGAFFVKGTSAITTFDSGGEIDVPGRPHAVFTPGHTHGHTCFHFPERGAVIAGDAVVMVDPYTRREGPAIVAGAATADSAMALRSLDALEATGAQTVLTGHGEPWTGGVAEACARARSAGSC